MRQKIERMKEGKIMQAQSIRVGCKVMLAMGIYVAVLGLLFLLAPQGSLEEAFT